MGVEIDRVALGIGFGAVHRVVGVAAQLLVARAVLRIDAHADRSRGKHLESLDLKWLLQALEHAVDDRADFILARHRIEKQQEFVAADAREHVAVAQAICDPPRDLHQQRVADRMAVVVVDVLEVVEVDECEREALAPVSALDGMLDVILDQDAVGRAGQFVEMNTLRQIDFDVLAVGDIERAGQQQRLAQDVHRLVRGEPGLLPGRACDAFLDRVHSPRFDQGRLPFPPVGGVVRRKKVGRGGANEGFGRRREIGRGHAVDQDETALGVLDRERNGQVIDDFLQQPVVLLRILLGLARLRDQEVEPSNFGFELVAVAHREPGERDNGALPGEGDVGGAKAASAGRLQQDKRAAVLAQPDRETERGLGRRNSNPAERPANPSHRDCRPERAPGRARLFSRNDPMGQERPIGSGGTAAMQHRPSFCSCSTMAWSKGKTLRSSCSNCASE